MRVLKFGGTSLANANRFIHVAKILENTAQTEQIAVVLSAPAMITNYLVSSIRYALNGNDISKSICKIEHVFFALLDNITQIQPNFGCIRFRTVLENEFDHLKKKLLGISLLKFCPENINASIVCLGEKLSVVLMQELLIAKNLKAIVIDPVKMILAQESGYSKSIVNIIETTRRISNVAISHVDIILMAGFTAGNKHGELVTLGRNGSDYSAAVLAACLGASCCEIWTDVDGIYTCDPHQVPEAKLLHSLSYLEAMELSYFGAKILHPRTIGPIAQFHIPCLIKNIDKPDYIGTVIGSHDKNSNNIVKGITYLQNMVMLNISGPGMKGMMGMVARVFEAMARAACSIALITQSSSEHSISFCIPHAEVWKACDMLNEEFYLELKNRLLKPIDMICNLAIISVIGEGIRVNLSGLSNKLFGALDRSNINIMAIAQGSSERSISVVVNNNAAIVGVKSIHQTIFNKDQIIELFIIGIGGVGSSLIKQIHCQNVWLKSKHIDLRIYGIMNSRIMLVNMNSINLNSWRESLQQIQEICDLKQLIKIIKENHLLNPVIVDCTDSAQVVNCYIDFLLSGCHVITSNKQANTGSMQYYHALRSAVTKARKKFLYDTNVGAGLPVIENLQKLIYAGDKLISFSGILSGSLSYIFGKLDEGVSLSEATLLAKQSGYTEPDPRNDLSGMDVARKLLILAREVGYELELTDIYVESVIPPNFINDRFVSINDFLQKLSSLDEFFRKKIKQAHSLGHVLRYIGNIEKGKCYVRIESVNNNHPLFKVKDGENALAFFTQYYQPLPLILRGYGAGNNVTAAGVFADLLRTLL